MRQVVPKGRPIPLSVLVGWLIAVAPGQARSVPGKSAPTLGALSTNEALPTEHRSRKLNLDVTTLHFLGEQAYLNDLSGQPNCLSLDKPLQENALRYLRAAKPKRGAIVVLRVSDGRVLTAADYPPHTPRLESVLWSALTPSASLFKLVTTAALVEQAKIHPEHRVCSEGGEHRLELEQLEAPKQGAIRCQPFSSILATSRNAAYARLVTSHLTSEDLSNFAGRFGFNSSQMGEFPIELGRYQPAHSPLGVARTATGFIGSSLSTFGAAYLGFVIANGGHRKPVQLFCEPGEEGEPQTVNPTDRVLLPETARRLRDMMVTVVRHGTAYNAFHDEAGRPLLPQLSVAGKTGTLGHDEGTNSWFTGFAPSRNPKYVVAVLLDNGSVFRSTAKTVAVEVLRDLFPSEQNHHKN